MFGFHGIAYVASLLLLCGLANLDWNAVPIAGIVGMWIYPVIAAENVAGATVSVWLCGIK
jgi:hypothetical protein